MDIETGPGRGRENAPTTQAADPSLPRSALEASDLIGMLGRNDPAELLLYMDRARAEAAAFSSAFKDPSNQKEPRREKLLGPAQEALLDGWLASEAGAKLAAGITADVIAIAERSFNHGHPGHDARHVLVKDPIAALRHALEDDLSGSRSLFMLPSLLHDIGRLAEPALFGQPQSGAFAKDHAVFGFMILKDVLDSALKLPPDRDSQLAEAAEILKGELLNAVLDHQTGNSRSSFIAQAVQRADREQLVGYEMIHRSISFDVGFSDQKIASDINPERERTLPLPGAKEDNHLFHHIEFYMRNLYANIGSVAKTHADAGKVESGTFLYLAAADAMRAQIFAPELAHDATGSVPQDLAPTKRPLERAVWERIRRGPDEPTLERMSGIKAEAGLEELTLRLLEAPFTTSPNAPGYQNWKVINARLAELDAGERERMQTAVAYALAMGEQAAEADKVVVGRAISQRPTHPVLGRIAEMLNRELCGEQ